MILRDFRRRKLNSSRNTFNSVSVLRNPCLCTKHLQERMKSFVMNATDFFCVQQSSILRVNTCKARGGNRSHSRFSRRRQRRWAGQRLPVSTCPAAADQQLRSTSSAEIMLIWRNKSLSLSRSAWPQVALNEGRKHSDAAVQPHSS